MNKIHAIKKIIFTGLFFMISRNAFAVSFESSDFAFTLAVVLSILIFVVLVLAVIVAFSLKKSAAEFSKLNSKQQQNSPEPNKTMNTRMEKKSYL